MSCCSLLIGNRSTILLQGCLPDILGYEIVNKTESVIKRETDEDATNHSLKSI